MCLYLNRRIKYIVWDSISGKQWVFLFVRVLGASTSICTNIIAVKHYDLTFVGVVNNTAPLITTVLAFIFLREGISAKTIVSLIICFAGATILKLGGQNASLVAEGSSWIAFVALMLNPVLMAFGIIVTRYMRDIREATVATYLFVALVVFITPVVYASGNDLSPWFSFSALDWCWLIGISLSSILYYTSIHVSLQNEKPSAL